MGRGRSEWRAREWRSGVMGKRSGSERGVVREAGWREAWAWAEATRAGEAE